MDDGGDRVRELRMRRGPDRADPTAIVRHLAAAGHDAFWIDAGPGARSGVSYVGTGLPADPAEALATPTASRDARPGADGPPFRGGWVGWLTYEDGVRAALDAPVAPSDERSRLLRVARMLAIDHATGAVTALAEADDPGADDAFAAWGALAPAADRSGDGAGDGAPDGVRAALRTARARVVPDAYAALIARCREYIRLGEAYQLCLTTRFDVEGPTAADASDVYAALRTSVSAHRGGLVVAGDRALASASPETFLTVRGRGIRTLPIKGTRPRGADDAEDAALAAELAADEKERAENVMIVDLMRNDLARLCEPGSVTVPMLWEVRSHPYVHQLVSEVAGRLRTGVDVGEILRDAFPAGSMTGAPKLAAVRALHALEGGPRGAYAGAFGWIGANGDLDLSMTIRAVVLGPDGAHVGAGGGITWSSVAEAEIAEVALKARGPLAAAGAALPPEWLR